MTFNGGEVEVEETAATSFNGIDMALFSPAPRSAATSPPLAAEAGRRGGRQHRRLAHGRDGAAGGARGQPRRRAKNHKGIIANPNCSTIQMVVALNPLHKVNPIKRVIVDTYQSVSGTGTPAMEELSAQSQPVLEGKAVVPHVYPHQIAFNLLPEIDVFLDNGYTKEEWKMVNETRKIMHAPQIAASPPPACGCRSSSATPRRSTSSSPTDDRRRGAADC